MIGFKSTDCQWYTAIKGNCSRKANVCLSDYFKYSFHCCLIQGSLSSTLLLGNLSKKDNRMNLMVRQQRRLPFMVFDGDFPKKVPLLKGAKFFRFLCSDALCPFIYYLIKLSTKLLKRHIPPYSGVSAHDWKQRLDSAKRISELRHI